MKAVNFYFVRHGETLLNSLKKAQGWCDSPLTEKGVHEARALGNTLGHIRFAAAYSSDTIRAYTTAELILSSSNQTVIKPVRDARLREWCLGNWEAESNKKFIADILLHFPKARNLSDLNNHLDEVCNYIYDMDQTGMAEPFDRISDRLMGFLEEMGARYLPVDNANILVVTHAFAMKTLLHLLSKEALDKAEKISNADYIRITWDGTNAVIQDAASVPEQR